MILAIISFICLITTFFFFLQINTSLDDYIKRSGEVLKFRNDMLDKIVHLSSNDKAVKGRDPYWRFVEYDKVSYSDMHDSKLPLEASSFYDDLSFLEPDDDM